MSQFFTNTMRKRAASEDGASVIEMVLITAGIAALIFFLWSQLSPAVEDSTETTVGIIEDGHDIIGN